ncbi:MAG: glycosyltransferase family 9 protein [Candidatus Xenobia bacterium]
MTRLLVVRMDAIGDTLLSLPALHALHQAMPEARLTVLASRSARGVLEGDPAIAQVIVPVQGFRPPAADVALAFTEKIQAYRWLAESGAKRRIGFWPGRAKPLKCLQLLPLLTDRVASLDDPRVNEGRHEVERYMDLVRTLGVAGPPGPIRVAVPPDAAEAALEWQSRQGLGEFVVVHLSEKWQRGGWPSGFVQQLVDAIPDAVLAWGPAEAAWADTLRARYRFYDPDLKRYAALLARARAVVTMDTSAAHLAAGVGTPLVDVFPSQHFAHNTTRWRPWQVPHVLLEKRDPQTLLEDILRGLDTLRQEPKVHGEVRR